MSEPFIAQIMQVGFNFAPRGWSTCDGQILPIASHTALFSLLGTTFGGDGRTTFGLPDLRGRISKHVGTGPGLTPVIWGQKGGAETVTLSEAQMPAHDHDLQATAARGDTGSPDGNLLADGRTSRVYSRTVNAPTATLNAESVADAGSGQAHENMMPFQVIRACVALQGFFPSRN